MEKRTILAIALSLAVLLGFQYFFPPTEKTPLPPSVSEKASSGPAAETMTTPASAPVPAPLPELLPTPGRTVKVDSRLYRADFNTVGGCLEAFYLKEYKADLSPDSPDLNLVTVSGRALYPLTGAAAFAGRWYEDAALEFRVEQDNLAVESGSRVLRLEAGLESGERLVKEIHFTETSYLLEVYYFLIDGDGASRPAEAVRLNWSHMHPAQEKKEYVYSGVLGYIGTELYKPSKKENQVKRQELLGPLTWLGYTSKYFISVLLVPEADAAARCTGSIERADATHLVTAIQLNQGNRIKVYIGPKQGALLGALGMDLEKSIEYGWFGVIARPLVEMMHFFYQYVHNYGIAIIIITILIKLAFYPLSQKSYKSMGKMKEVQPKLAKLKEKYKDDKARLNKEMMDLYRTHKVNPFGGCLPIVVQIPVFFALYRALMVAIELRHAPFFGWILDLSAKDPYYVTPLIMGATMFLQQKMTPSTGDAMQARMMLFMPIIFTFMFLNFPSGLVLYWLVNNVLSIGQQYMVMRQTKTA
ncbi:MAG: membrane protein insertase YidC [Deltaproteobacteria bacterium]|nr:membrane protein insertase YidC [Deltaproteobacteria bacterium]